MFIFVDICLPRLAISEGSVASYVWMTVHSLLRVDVEESSWGRLLVRQFDSTWGVQVLRSPNYFLGEWKQIET